MKRGLASDLHLDFGPMNPEFFSWRGDELFLAGDVGEEDRIRKEDMRPFWDGVAEMAPRTYMICGNHEHYGSELDASYDHLREFFAKHYPNVTLLQNETVELSDGKMLFGTTLWTDFGGNPLSELHVSTSLNDYRQIRVKKKQYKRVNVSDIRLENRIAYNHLLNALEQHTDLIVMTHHAPSWTSIPSRFATPENFHLNTGYANRLDSLIESCQNVQTWVHGHIHNRSDYMIGSTRVVANPRGYPREKVEWYTETYLPFEF